ncbi:MAG: TRAP transporter small permease [Gammaproteobacteria bacterium]|nr:TRAP transporter small permease [Gammaproteobacteria bacterium]
MTAQTLQTDSSLVRGLIRVNRIYESVLYYLGAALMGAMVVVVVAQIFARYVLGDSLSWSDELARFLMIWITFLFAGISFRRGEMIAVEALSAKLPRSARAALTVAGSLFSILLFGLLVWFGYSYAEWNKVQTSSALRVSLYFVYLAVPVGCGLMVPHIVIGTFLSVRKLMAVKS